MIKKYKYEIINPIDEEGTDIDTDKFKNDGILDLTSEYLIFKTVADYILNGVNDNDIDNDNSVNYTMFGMLLESISIDWYMGEAFSAIEVIESLAVNYDIIICEEFNKKKNKDVYYFRTYDCTTIITQIIDKLHERMCMLLEDNIVILLPKNLEIIEINKVNKVTLHIKI